MKLKNTFYFVTIILLFTGCSDSLQDQYFQENFQIFTAFVNSTLLYSPLVLLIFSLYKLTKYGIVLLVSKKEKKRRYKMYWRQNLILYPALPYIIFAASWVLAFLSVKGVDNGLEKLVVLKDAFLLAFTAKGLITYRIFLVLFTVAYFYFLHYLCFFGGTSYKEWEKEYEKNEAKRKKVEKRKKKAIQKAAQTKKYDRDDDNWWERMDDLHVSPFDFKRRRY